VAVLQQFVHLLLVLGEHHHGVGVVHHVLIDDGLGLRRVVGSSELAGVCRGPNPAPSSVQAGLQFAEVLRAEVAEELSFHVSPDMLDGVEFRGIRGQVLHGQTLFLINEGPQGLRVVNTSVVQHHDDIAPHVSKKMTTKGQDLRSPDGTRNGVL
jgi:hypothetical protein